MIDLLLLSAGSSLRLVTAGAMTYIGCELRVAEYYEKKEEKNWRGGSGLLRSEVTGRAIGAARRAAGMHLHCL